MTAEGTLAKDSLAPALLVQMHDCMLRARLLDERLIRMQKQGDGYFWVGGPGEEAFNVPLGLLLHKGEGLAYDFLHFHYRSTATLLAMGMPPIDTIRQMKNTSTDPFSGGRNFVGHYAVKHWNVVPVSSPIEVQFVMALGTALAQRRAGGHGITIVVGGDAGTAEGDFASCLIWSSRPGAELPVLMIVTNNGFGISTAASTQHSEKRISDRAAPFGIEARTIDGNDPEISYRELSQAMHYVRTERRPFLLEANVSRLYGHSSSSGANFIEDEVDALTQFETRLVAQGLRTREQLETMRHAIERELLDATKQVRNEPGPEGPSAFDHVFAGQLP